MNDRGALHVLEVVLISVVMVGAIAFVITFDEPQFRTEPERQNLAESGLDALNIIYETPLTDVRYGNNTLSKYIALALQGNEEPLVNRLRELLPPATEFNVYLNNGYDSLVVYESRTPTGETVSASRLLEPKWTYVFTERSHGYVTWPTSLGVYALPVYNSNPIDDGGVPLEVQITGINDETKRSFRIDSYYSTTQSATGSSTANVALYMRDSQGLPTLYFDRVNDSNSTYFVAIEDAEGVGIPVGAKLTIRIPRSFEATAAVIENPGWSIIEGSTDYRSGGALEAVWMGDGPLTKGTFRFSAVHHGDVHDFSRFDIRLSGSVHGVAEVVVRTSNSPVPTGSDFHGVHASVPKPMGTGATNLWGVSFLNPRTLLQNAPTAELKALSGVNSAVANWSRGLTVTRVEIIQPDGVSLFAGVQAFSNPANGVWSVDSSSRLVWEGSASITPNTVAEWLFFVTGTGQETRRDLRDYVLVDTAFSGHSATLLKRIQPSIFYDDVRPRFTLPTGALEAPERDGYAWNLGAPETYKKLNTTVSHRGLAIPGAWHYNTSMSAPSVDNLNLANVSVRSRPVAVTETAYVDVDVRNLVLALAERGLSATTTFRVYPSWALDNHIPIATSSTTETGLLTSGIKQLVVRDVNKDFVDDVIVVTSSNTVFALDGRSGNKLTGYSGSIKAFNLLTHNPSTATTMRVGNIAGETVFIIGTKAGSPNVFVLNENLTTRFELGTASYYQGLQGPAAGLLSASEAVNGFDIISVDARSDLDGDGYNDIAVGDAGGRVFVFSGANGDLLPGWPHSTTGTDSIVRSGVFGQDSTHGIVATTGQELDAGLADREIDLEDSTMTTGLVESLTEVLKKPYIQIRSPGVISLDEHRQPIWILDGGTFDGMDAQDLDGNGRTDVVGGSASGFVYALNGTFASQPYAGEAYLTGTRIVDMSWVDQEYGWTLSHDGMLMFTDSGFTTRTYYFDPVLQYFAFPFANALSFVDRETGVVVGHGGRIWKTVNGGHEFESKTFTLTIPLTVPIVGIPLGDIVVGSSTYSIPGHLLVDHAYRDAHMFDENAILIAGDVCTSTCDGRPLLLSSGDGGTNWYPATWSGMPSTSDLLRIVPVSPITAYVVGEDGVVARGVRGIDNNWTFALVASPGPETLRGGFFSSSLDGFVLGDGGALYRTADGGSSWARIETQTTNTLRDIDFLPPAKGGGGMWGAIVGDDGLFLQSYDGGNLWNVMPPYSLSDYRRIRLLDDDYGFITGGNVTTRFVGTIHAYMPESTLTTLPIATIEAHGAFVNDITVTPAYVSPGDMTSMTWEASVDGGDNWFPLEESMGTNAAGKTVPIWRNDSFAATHEGAEVRLRVTIHTDMIINWKTLILKSIHVQVGYQVDDVQDTLELTRTVTPEFLDQVDWPNTTADVNVTHSDIRSSRMTRLWTVHLAGEVRDLRFVEDTNGDGHPDVVIATGGVLSAVNLTHARIDLSKMVDMTNRVFLYDGQTGARLWASEAFPGPVRFVRPIHLALTDDERTDVAAIVEVTTNASQTTDRLYLLNGTNGAIVAGPYELSVPVTSVAAGDLVLGPGQELAIGTHPPPTIEKPGSVIAYGFPETGSETTHHLWSSNPNLKGVYTFSYAVPENSLFGVYPVEIEVAWEDTELSEFFSQRSLTYFVVTPRGHLLPTSPVYNVELVAWYREWDFS